MPEAILEEDVVAAAWLELEDVVDADGVLLEEVVAAAWLVLGDIVVDEDVATDGALLPVLLALDASCAKIH